MENAHLRLGQLEFRQSTDKISTTLRVHCDCYMGEEEQGLLLSIFGGDTEIAAISAAVAAQFGLLAEIPRRGWRDQPLRAHGGERGEHARHDPDSRDESSRPAPGRCLPGASPERNRWEHVSVELLPGRGLGLDGLGDGVAGATGVGLLGHRPAGLAAPDLSADRLRLQSVQHPGDTRRAAQHSQPRRPEHEPTSPMPMARCNGRTSPSASISRPPPQRPSCPSQLSTKKCRY